MKALKIYRTSQVNPKIVPAPMSREWMNRTTNGFANRCLPLRMGCAQGWQALCHAGFFAVWNGGSRPEDIMIVGLGDMKPWVNSHFGYGVLTFSNHFLVQTPEDYDLVVAGPTNQTKLGIQPLTGVIESSWMHMSFTMNWKMTHPGLPVHFEVGEPYMQFWPTKRADLETFEPTIEDLDACPFKDDYEVWSEARDGFHQRIREGDAAAIKQGWQKDYYKAATRKVAKLKEVRDVENV